MRYWRNHLGHLGNLMRAPSFFTSKAHEAFWSRSPPGFFRPLITPQSLLLRSRSRSARRRGGEGDGGLSRLVRTCTGDSAPHRDLVALQRRDDPPTPNSLSNSIHAWPDMRQFQRGYQTAFSNFGNNQPALLFSSVDDQVVQTHFRWMAENGVDTAALQRFDPVGERRSTPGTSWRPR